MELVLRASFLFLFLWLLTRALGKRELAEMSAFELLLLVTVGDLIQQGVTQEDFSTTGAVLAVSTIAVWITLFSWVSFRWKGAERLVEGMPVLVVKDGEPINEALHIERVSIDELKEGARQQGIRDLAEVRVGILEPDGRFSFIRTDGGDSGSPPEKHRA
jgi:uncharacterized membrane protein YcaP (DUF421 family)